MNLDQPSLRVATADDAPRILTLMKESAAALFPRFYDARQTASAVRHVAQVVDELIACGGWSMRDKLYTGAGDSSGDGRALDPAREPARVRAMFVRADWTRRGLGRRRVRIAVERGHARQCGTAR